MPFHDLSPVTPAFIRLTAEDQTRLNTKLTASLGLGRLTSRERKIALKNFSEGLCRLSDVKAHANDWAAAIDGLINYEIDDSAQAAMTAAPNPILVVLKDQPSNSRTSDQRKRCMALGALSLIATMFGLAKLPSDFTNGLRQLFRSDKDGWLELCNINFLDSVTLQAWNPVTTVAVVLDFRQTLINLLDTGIPTLVIYLSPGQPINKRAPGQIGDSLDEQPVSIEKLKVTKPPDDVSPNFLLFEMQRLRGTRDDVTDGYRLPLHRPRLNPCELKVVLAKLRNHLINSAADEAGWKKKAHAVARIVALLCGLSLKRCFGLPLVRKGSMRLDIEQGVLRRDILVIAPRKDTPNSQRFCGRWWRTRLPQEVHVVLRQLLSRTSHAKTLGDLLKAEGLDHTMCQDFLREDWHSSHFPEDSRFALSFRPCLLSLGIHPALVARLTGDTMTTPPSDIYYLSFTEVQVHEAMSAFCVWAGLTPPNAPVRNRSIGTPKALSLDQFQQLIEKLNQKVSIARNAVGPKSPIADVIVFHNIYTKSVALQLIWGVGARGDRIPSLTFERMFASEDFIAIADRRVDRYSRQRIIPCPRVLTETRKRYLEHLCAVSARLESADNENSRLFVQAASGKRPHDSAFLIFDETRDGWVTRGLTRKDLVALANELGASDLNTGRHFWFTELMTRNISEVAIEALLGHHINKAEAFGFSSGVSVREVSDYVCPIVEDVQHLLGFRSLVGCGRKAERFLKLAELVARRSLRPLPSRLLRRKLDAQDFLIDEVAMYQQDPPSTCKTLTAHAQLTRMKKNYVKSSAIGSYPEGALLFCLIAMDLVLANIEQRALFAAALGEGLTATGKLAVVEASDGNRPIVQRLVSVHTLVAAETVRRSNANHPKTYTIAQTQLHQLLLLLSPGWAGRNSEDSATLLSTLASHWAAIEIPHGTLFGDFHKAPFLPVADLARLHFKRACRISAGYDLPVPPLQRKFKNYFEPSLNIVKYWGDKDHPLGEDRARRKGCTEALREHAQQERLDEIGALFVDLLCADLSKEAPFRTLRAYP